MDEVPIEFGGLWDTTAADTGSKQVHVKTPMRDVERRVGTFVFALNPVACTVNPGLVFDLAPSVNPLTSELDPRRPFKKANREEFEKLRADFTGVDLLVQPKAWVNRPTARAWADLFKQQAPAGKKLLAMDNLDSHQTDEFKAFMEQSAETEVVFSPADTTDLMQPVDDNIGKSLKGRVKAKLALDYESRPDA